MHDGTEQFGNVNNNRFCAINRCAMVENNIQNDKGITPKKQKTPAESAVEMTQLVLPNDTNILGNLLGGTLMHWIGIAGAMAASRHSNRVVATVALDSLDFRHPVRCGELVILKAKLTWVGRTSMEVKVEVFAENYRTGAIIQTNKAYITYVALDDEGNPTPVPELIPETEEEKIEYEEAKRRREERLARKKTT